MAAKNIPDFDPALLALEDLFEFFDVSAQANRHGTFSDLAGVMAGPGLQDYDGKLGLGGEIDRNVVIGLKDQQSFILQTADYDGLYFSFESYLGASSYSLYGASFGFGKFAGLNGNSNRIVLEAEDSFEGTTSNININADGNIYIATSSGLVSSNAPLYYEATFTSLFDSENDILPTAGWVRSKLPAQGTYLEVNAVNNLTVGERTSLLMNGPNDFDIDGGFTADFTTPTGLKAYFDMTITGTQAAIELSRGGAGLNLTTFGEAKLFAEEGQIAIVGQDKAYLELLNGFGGGSYLYWNVSNLGGDSSQMNVQPNKFDLSASQGAGGFAGFVGRADLGMLHATFSESFKFEALNDARALEFVNLSNAGSSKLATGSAAAPASYLGDSTYWLGRPAHFIRAIVEGVPGFIPFYL